MVICFLTLFVSGITLIFLVASHAPATYNLPQDDRLNILSLNPAWSNALTISEDYGALLSLPVILTSILGFSYAGMHQLSAMARSNLMLLTSLPSFKTLSHDLDLDHVALLQSLLSGLTLLLLGYWIFTDWVTRLYELALLGSIIAQTGNFVSFLVFRHSYKSLKRIFTSPLGNLGALWGMFVFACIFIGVCLRPEGISVLTLFLSLMALGLLVYIFFTSRSQVFSDEEEAVLFLAHVIKCT